MSRRGFRRLCAAYKRGIRDAHADMSSGAECVRLAAWWWVYGRHAIDPMA